MSLRAWVLLSLALLPLWSMAQEPLSVESVAAGYFGLQSYCDAGKRSWRDDPKRPYTQELAFTRCARADGRFKYVESEPRGGATAKWSDGKQVYRYLAWGRRYQELPFNDGSLYGFYEVRSEVFPVFVFELFSNDARSLVRKDQRASYLRSFTPDAARSTPEHTVFERMDPGARSGERLWIRNAGRKIVRHESLRDGGVVRLVEVGWLEVNRPLSDAELWHETPLLARYSLMNNPAVFMSGLVVAAGLLGTLFWALLVGLGISIAAKRRRLWLAQAWGFGAIALLLGALALLTAGGGGGHPPAIVYVWVLAIWAGVAFAMSALFTLASYPVEFALKRLVHRAGGSNASA
jgi:hypothetical protein